MEYDDIIVGGGSAGATLATRLSENEDRRVLLIEAGPDEATVTEADRLADQMRVPATLTGWGIDATFVPGMTLNYPQGRRMGGGSAVNGAFAVRGIPDDYERWAGAAGEQWSWAHMARALRRLEADQDFSDDFHGTDGPVPIVRWRRDELLPAQEAFLDAVTEHSIGWVDDHNAPGASGIGAIPMNRRDGVRMSTALTYLPLARGRRNLTIRPLTQVTRVVLEAGRAVGVECRTGGEADHVRGARVIVSAGAFQSPALLLRSGIGPSGHLGEVGVDCAVDLPGVGENLMDHQGTVVFLLPRDELGQPDVRACQLGARYSSGVVPAHDDMWLSMWSPWDLEGFPDLRTALGAPVVSAIIAGVHDPLSRGTVRLRSADPGIAPEVDFRMLSDPADLARMVQGLELALDLAASPAFAKAYSGIGLLDPASAGNRDALEGYIKATVGGWFHASGTCRMGTDADGGAVVDGNLRVHGVDGLHVVDASVMPTVVRAPTNLSSIAIAERAAELLR